jgi:hypothetical protein
LVSEYRRIKKMKSIYTVLIVVIIITFQACKSSQAPVAPEPVGDLKVKGKVSLNGEPVQGALVAIDDVVNWKTTSGSDGSFEINGVSNGSHTISAKKELDEGKIVFQSRPIVTENPENDIGILDLPTSLNLQPISNAQPDQIPLTWDKVSSGLTAYKIYRKDAPGVDETTGELIYTTANLDENTFVDTQFRTGRTYYYRVYAYLENGRYAGSNIVTTAVPEVNIVVNGDFELSTTGILPDNWDQTLSGSPEFNYFEVSSDNVISGTNSLKVTYIDSLANPLPGFNPWGGLKQVISIEHLKPGDDYTISFWTRSEIGNMQVRLLKNGDFNAPVVSYIIPNDQEWTEHSVNFKIDAETTYLELWINTRSGFAANGLVKGWIDNLKIIR